MRTLSLLAGAAALSLSACSLLGDDPSPSPSTPAIPPPPTEVNSIYGLYGLDAAYEQYDVSEAENRDQEREVQACMQAAGWEYWLPAAFDEPIHTPDPAETFSQAAEDAKNLEGAAATGFYIVLNTLENEGFTGAVGPRDANWLYMSALTPQDRSQYQDDLWGANGCFETHHPTDATEADQFIQLAQRLSSEFEYALYEENPYSSSHFEDDGSSGGADSIAFDPALDAANTAYRNCLRDLGYDDSYNPYEFQESLGAELRPQVKDAVDGLAPVAFADMPSDARAEVDRLLAIETAAAVATYPCAVDWQEATTALSREWQRQYLAEHWESIWADIDLLRQRDDAPPEWAAQWDDYPPSAP